MLAIASLATVPWTHPSMISNLGGTTRDGILTSPLEYKQCCFPSRKGSVGARSYSYLGSSAGPQGCRTAALQKKTCGRAAWLAQCPGSSRTVVVWGFHVSVPVRVAYTPWTCLSSVAYASVAPAPDYILQISTGNEENSNGCPWERALCMRASSGQRLS